MSPAIIWKLSPGFSQKIHNPLERFPFNPKYSELISNSFTNLFLKQTCQINKKKLYASVSEYIIWSLKKYDVQQIRV